MTKLEKVAAAISTERNRLRVEHNVKLAKRGFWPDHSWEPSDEDLARAALQALREPTLEMIVAGVDAHQALLGGHSIGDPKGSRFNRQAAGFRAMIDAALKEGGG